MGKCRSSFPKGVPGPGAGALTVAVQRRSRLNHLHTVSAACQSGRRRSRKPGAQSRDRASQRHSRKLVRRCLRRGPRDVLRSGRTPWTPPCPYWMPNRRRLPQRRGTLVQAAPWEPVHRRALKGTERIAASGATNRKVPRVPLCRSPPCLELLHIGGAHVSGIRFSRPSAPSISCGWDHAVATLGQRLPLPALTKDRQNGIRCLVPGLR